MFIKEHLTRVQGSPRKELDAWNYSASFHPALDNHCFLKPFFSLPKDLSIIQLVASFQCSLSNFHDNTIIFTEITLRGRMVTQLELGIWLVAHGAHKIPCKKFN